MLDILGAVGTESQGPIFKGSRRDSSAYPLKASRVTALWLPGSRTFSVGSEPGHPEETFLVDPNGKEAPLTPEGIRGIAVTTDGKRLLVTNVRRYGPQGTVEIWRAELASFKRMLLHTVTFPEVPSITSDIGVIA